MEISPDNIIYWQWGPAKLNATIVFTWVVMALMVLGSWLITRRLASGTQLPRGQALLEIVIGSVQSHIREISLQDPNRYLIFIGTLFLFIAISNLLVIVPGFHPPTGSLSTTAALAICVFIAVPFFGIVQQGLRGYLRQYIQPSVVMLPFNIIGEFSRTLALAVRLFGNVMSSTLLVAILLTIVPLFFPVIMQALGLLTGFIQAYIFAILAMVYIASATRTHHGTAAGELEKGDK